MVRNFHIFNIISRIWKNTQLIFLYVEVLPRSKVLAGKNRNSRGLWHMNFDDLVDHLENKNFAAYVLWTQDCNVGANGCLHRIPRPRKPGCLF